EPAQQPAASMQAPVPGQVSDASNFYVYDEAGQPVDAARIFDQYGNPVTVAEGELWERDIPTDVYGAPQPNTFPMTLPEMPRPWSTGEYLPDRDAPYTPPQSIAPLETSEAATPTAPATDDVATPTGAGTEPADPTPTVTETVTSPPATPTPTTSG
ncbi:MAG: hypothetical protein Q4G43_16975, partial [Mobilicoccus sp.]|nr:hypothetical protein [Mobilicoccus sp.]